MVEDLLGKVKMRRVDGGEDTIEYNEHNYTTYGAAAELASNYHLPMPVIHRALQTTYRSETIPANHLSELGAQIEQQFSQYEEDWHKMDVALALVKADGFEKHNNHGIPVYTARISFSKERAKLYRTADELAETELARDKSFHYEGYNFDSGPESDYLERVLGMLKQNPEIIEGIWFTGGLTDPGKTELFAEYLGEDKRWHRYTPDFVIARKDGKYLIVEIKSDQFSAALNEDLKRHNKGEKPLTIEGRKAVALKRWEELNPDVLHYSVIFADSQIPENSLDRTQDFIKGS